MVASLSSRKGHKVSTDKVADCDTAVSQFPSYDSQRE